MLLKLKESKVVFAAFMQTLHTEYSNVTQSITHVKYSVYRASRPSKGEGYLFESLLVGLAVHHQSVGGGSFVNFLGLVKLQGWLQARCTANPHFLKLRGAQQPSNSYISMEQSCILHTLTKLPA